MEENICICIVCLKTFSTSTTNETATAASPHQTEKCGVSLLTKFLKFAKNYLQIPSEKLLNVNGCASGKVSCSDTKDVFCEKCELAVITPICQVYLEFLSAQLRLSWELEQLGKLMEESSSLNKFDNINKLGVVNIITLTEQLGIESVSHLKEFRSLLSQKCKLKRKLALPDVFIGPRCEHDDDDIDDHHEVFEHLHSEEASNPIDFILHKEGDHPRHDNNWDGNGFFEIESDAIKLESVDLPSDDHYILPENDDGKQDDDDVRNQLKFEEVIVPELFEDEVEIHHPNVVEPPPRTHTPTPEVNSVANNNKRKHFSCSQCDKIYVTALRLRLHCANVHSQPAQEFKCPICAKGFARRRTMYSHKHSVHTKKKKSFSCSQCSIVYTSNWRLQHHIKAVHNPETHVCVKCNRVFPTIKHLKSHCERTHPQPGQQEIKCPICAKGFATRYKMMDHKTYCNSTKRFSCPQCSLVYSKNYNLKCHIKAVHNPETHVCVECNKLFPTIKHLKSHCERTHPQPGQQEFKCPICAKGFATRYKMMDHKRWSHNTKSYSCSQCSAVYTSNSNLQYHIKAVHNPEIHVCVECNKVLATIVNLKLHYKRFHHLQPGSRD